MYSMKGREKSLKRNQSDSEDSVSDERDKTKKRIKMVGGNQLSTGQK